MKVRFIGLPDGVSDSWLRGGDVYTVLQIHAGSSGVHYRIASGTPPVPVLHPATAFSVVTSDLPRSWIVNANPEKAFVELAPAAWCNDGFWEKFFDNDAEAVKVFESESYRIAVESEG